MTIATWSHSVLAELDDDIRVDLADSLATAIELHFDLTVSPADSFGERGAGGWCDGVSIIDSGVILYRPTPSRRENFTLMHELGHHLIDNNIDCLAWIADQPDPPKVLEQLCDQIAADLLIPAAVVDQLVRKGSPDACAVLDLSHQSEASRSACAIAIARRLPCDGFVVLVEDGASAVFFGARARDTRPYGWRNDQLPASHPLRQSPPPARALAWWPYPTGSDRREYFMSTASAGGWTIASALLGLAVGRDDAAFVLLGIYAVVGLGGLDAYYLALERRFIDLYESARTGQTEPFVLNPRPPRWADLRVLHSPSVAGFHGVTLLVLASVVVLGL